MFPRRLLSCSKNVLSLLTYSGISGILAGSVVFFLPENNKLDSYGMIRLGRAAYTVLKITYIYNQNLYAKHYDCNTDDYRKWSSFCHKKGAEELLKLCCLNKGVYIKVGQHLAALDYLIPTEYVETMKVLHSNGPTTNMDDVYKVIKEDLKQDPKDVFTFIDPQPIGVASLAQVHKATLKDGSTVALKVQHSYVKGHTMVDMKSMEYLVNIVGFIFPDFKFHWFVDEMKTNIPLELDFINEGKNSEKIFKLMSKSSPWLFIPKVNWNLTSSRILTMDYVEGGHINDLKYMETHGIDPADVSDKLSQLYSEMIFIHGFVHSDPHPGNILIRNNSKINGCELILLDHGLYATLKKDFMAEYAKLWLSILDKDKIGMEIHSKNLGVNGDGMYGLFACMVTGRSWSSIIGGLEKVEPTKEETERVQSRLPEVFPHMAKILQSVNRQMYLIFKANGLVHGLEHTLRTKSRKCTFKTMCRCCVRSVYGKKLDESTSKIEKIKVAVIQYWLLLKITVYYTMSSVQDLLKMLGV
nr:uncharacterized aarF domain-containing protein kinase 1-like [Onthophagus taurus]